MNAHSRLTQKFQATIPLKIRTLLGLGLGDTLKFELEGDKVVLKKATALEVDYLQALEGTLSEWASPLDDEAFRGL